MNRLDTLVSFIDKNKFVADIGADHGLTSIKVYEEKTPRRIIATDISKNSLKKLIDRLPELNYNIETMVTDGIYNLPEGVEQIIISGMGGYLIGQILERGIEKAKSAEKLILQGNNCQDYLRHWLHSNGFEIIDESILEENDFIYNVIVAKFANTKEYYPNEMQYRYGKKNIEDKNPLTIKTLRSDIEHLNNIILKIESIKSDETIRRAEEIKKEKEILENLLCELEK